MRDRIVIVGAGPNGLCLAKALAARDLAIEVVERQPAEALAEPAFDGREIALTHASMRVLRELGIWQHLPADAAAPVRAARIRDAARPGFEIDGAAFGRERIGALVSNCHIRAAAWRAVAETPAIHVHTGVAVEAVTADADRASVRLADGRVLEADLLVAADSRFSPTRRLVGIGAYEHDMGLSMLLARVRHEVDNEGVAWEWFDHGQTRALLPLEPHVSSIVLTLPGAEAARLIAAAPEAFAAEVARRYAGELGAVELISTRHSHPLVATFAHRFVGTRFALVGDAAVGMHPVTAHGFNLGISSIERLAAAAAGSLRRHQDVGRPSGLARYQRQHRLEGAPLFAGTQAIAGLFTDERALAQPLRRAAIGLGRRVPALRRALALAVLDEAPRPLGPRQHLCLAAAALRPRLAPRSS